MIKFLPFNAQDRESMIEDGKFEVCKGWSLEIKRSISVDATSLMNLIYPKFCCLFEKQNASVIRLAAGTC